jgi:ABC-type iron transport system FetAB permease component
VLPRLKEALEIAASEAVDAAITPELALLGLVSVKGSVAEQILAAHALTIDGLRAAFSPATR